MAVGGDLAWVSDIDKSANTLLAYRHPKVPNLGDLKQVDWSTVEPVDVLTAGYPCQPFSTAGKRKGIDDERHIWPWISDAIRVLRPRFVVLENVAGHLRSGFGEVLGSLAEVGYDCRWASVRACAVGAPHRRERVFVLAADSDRQGLEGHWRFHREVREVEAASHHPSPFWQGRSPHPVERGELSPRFVEWMMGLPEGWVTDIPITRNQQLKLLGNGVVPQQARYALDLLGGDVLGN